MPVLSRSKLDLVGIGLVCAAIGLLAGCGGGGGANTPSPPANSSAGELMIVSIAGAGSAARAGDDAYKCRRGSDGVLRCSDD